MSTIAVNAITDANSGNTTTINSVTPNVHNTVGKNLVINGAMQIDQRNATTTALGYTLDRFYLFRSSNHDQHAFSVVQDTDAPDGFSNSLKYTTTTAETTVDADELLYLRQRIEATNLQQLAYGTTSAKKVTLSFWVKSSVTGTFAVSLYQQDGMKNLSKTYTINSANTWEKKTITYIGNTSNAIIDDTGIGIQIDWILSAGSDYTSTDSSSAWTAYGSGESFAYGHGTNAVATTLNATWQLTGVQLEVGESATEFEHRPYGTELLLCQRYYNFYEGDNYSCVYSTSNCFTILDLPAEMRATPTVGYSDRRSGASNYYFSSYNYPRRVQLLSAGITNGYVTDVTLDSEL